MNEILHIRGGPKDKILGSRSFIIIYLPWKKQRIPKGVLWVRLDSHHAVLSSIEIKLERVMETVCLGIQQEIQEEL